MSFCKLYFFMLILSVFLILNGLLFGVSEGLLVGMIMWFLLGCCNISLCSFKFCFEYFGFFSMFFGLIMVLFVFFLSFIFFLFLDKGSNKKEFFFFCFLNDCMGVFNCLLEIEKWLKVFMVMGLIFFLVMVVVMDGESFLLSVMC